jgi:hypothetical protein
VFIFKWLFLKSFQRRHCLKGQSHENFDILVFLKSNPHNPLIHILKPFQIWLWIFWDNQLLTSFCAMGYSVESFLVLRTTTRNLFEPHRLQLKSWLHLWAIAMIKLQIRYKLYHICIRVWGCVSMWTGWISMRLWQYIYISVQTWPCIHVQVHIYGIHRSDCVRSWFCAMGQCAELLTVA